MDGPGRELGPGNTVSGTVPQENALNRHGAGSILGMVRLVLPLPLRGLARSSLTMTDGNCNFWQTVSLADKPNFLLRLKNTMRTGLWTSAAGPPGHSFLHLLWIRTVGI